MKKLNMLMHIIHKAFFTRGHYRINLEIDGKFLFPG